MALEYNPETGEIRTRFGWSKGGKVSGGYLATTHKGKLRAVHRIAFDLMGVTIPDGMQVDHINGQRTDNRWNNLRLVSASGNMHNLGGPKESNCSGYLGVSRSREQGRLPRFRAQLTIQGVVVLRKWFSSPEEAASAYIQARQNHSDELPHNSRLETV